MVSDLTDGGIRLPLTGRRIGLMLLLLFSTEATEFRAIGTSLSRLEKARLVTNLVASYEYLDVCTADPDARMQSSIPNCSACWKCVRQLMTLELLGQIDQYKNVFDLEKFRANRKRLVREFLYTAFLPNRPNEQDVVRLAQELGVVKKYNFDLLIKLGGIHPKVKSILSRVILRDYLRGVKSFRR